MNKTLFGGFHGSSRSSFSRGDYCNKESISDRISNGDPFLEGNLGFYESEALRFVIYPKRKWCYEPDPLAEYHHLTTYIVINYRVHGLIQSPPFKIQKMTKKGGESRSSSPTIYGASSEEIHSSTFSPMPSPKLMRPSLLDLSSSANIMPTLQSDDVLAAYFMSEGHLLPSPTNSALGDQKKGFLLSAQAISDRRRSQSYAGHPLLESLDTHDFSGCNDETCVLCLFQKGKLGPEEEMKLLGVPFPQRPPNDITRKQ